LWSPPPDYRIEGTQALATANTIAPSSSAVVARSRRDSDSRGEEARARGSLIGAVATDSFIRRGDLALASTLSDRHRPPCEPVYEAPCRCSKPSGSTAFRQWMRAVGYTAAESCWRRTRWIQRPAFLIASGEGCRSGGVLPARLAFVSVAVWWIVFSLPLLRRVPEPPRTLEPDEPGRGSVVGTSFARLGETLRQLMGFRQAFLMLLAFLIYNDGIQTIIKMATAYGTEIGIGQSSLITAVLLVQFVGVPCAFLFGVLASRIGAKRSVFVGLVAYTVISVIGYFMTTAAHFFILAALVGVVQGGTQALSRSLFATLIPAHKSGEFFGFYSVFEKFSSIFGPLLFSLTVRRPAATTRSCR
jgi:UMF1 family MFS transporter